MEAFEIRRVVTKTEYVVPCNSCGAELRGEMSDFKPISPFKFAYRCPACHRRGYVRSWQIKKRTVMEGGQILEDGSRVI